MYLHSQMAAGWAEHLKMHTSSNLESHGRWSCQRRGVEESGNPEDFYEDRCCQDIFQNLLATITSRINTITGTAYRCCKL